MKKNIIFKLFFILVAGTSCHVGRYFIYNFANYNDYKKFPARTIEAPDETFYFQQHIIDTLLQNHPLPADTDSFENFLENKRSLAFTVIQNDTIKYQWYKEKFDSASIFTTFSMAKSFVGLLIGIAVEERHIKSIHDPITTYIPELPDKGEFDKITIEHLLNMQSGLRFSESYFNPFADVAKYYYGRDILKYISKLKIDSEPGQKFEYKSLDTQLLGIIIEKATGKTLSAYLEEKIWQPLHMQYPASWTIDKNKNGVERAFCCLQGRVEDFAKIGKLMLQKGRWKNQQIVPAAWIEKSVQGSINYKYYSYQWWPMQDDDAYMAQGILGQYLYVNPAKNLIILRFGKKWGKEVSWRQVFHLIAAAL